MMLAELESLLIALARDIPLQWCFALGFVCVGVLAVMEEEDGE